MRNVMRLRNCILCTWWMDSSDSDGWQMRSVVGQEVVGLEEERQVIDNSKGKSTQINKSTRDDRGEGERAIASRRQ